MPAGLFERTALNAMYDIRHQQGRSGVAACMWRLILRHAHRVAVCLGIAMVVVLSGCGPSNHPGQTASSSTPSTTGGLAGGRTGASSPFGRDRLFTGDAASLRAYLENVREVRPTRFAVTWTPQTVRIDRATALRSLQGISRDGARFTFSGDDGAIAQLAPGKVMLLWGLALRKVDRVAHENGRIVVDTGPAKLTDAISEGDIAFAAQVPLAQFLPTVQMPAKPADTGSDAQPQASVAGRRSRWEWLIAAAHADEPPPAAAPAQAPGGALDTPPATTPDGKFTGVVAGYEYLVSYKSAGHGIDFDAEIRKEQPDLVPNPKGENSAGAKGYESTNDSTLEQAGVRKSIRQDAEIQQYDKQHAGAGSPAGMVKSLFKAGSDLLDLRVKADGVLNPGSGAPGGDIPVETQFLIRHSQIERFAYNMGGMTGHVNFHFIARLGEQQGQWLEHAKLELPISMNVPLIVAGIPFVFQIGANFFVQPALSGHKAALTGNFGLNFVGNGQVQVYKGAMDEQGNLTATPPLVGQVVGSSIGVSAIVVAAQIPRIGFGVGVFDTASVAFVDHVISVGLTKSSSLGMFPMCKTYQIYQDFGAGISTHIGLQIPGVTAAIEKKLSGRKSIKRTAHNYVDPPIKACQV